MSKKTRKLKSALLSSISDKYVEDHELLDTPSRLFRKILNQLNMDPHLWGAYLRDYLNWVITTSDREKANEQRLTRAGNIKETYFHKPTLTFNKLLEGLSILRMESCEITIKVKDSDGKEIVVTETIRIVGKSRPASTPVSEE